MLYIAEDIRTTKRKKKRESMKSKNIKNETKIIEVNYIWLVRSAEVPSHRCRLKMTSSGRNI
jgi:hypothetical protein